jgi:hypothetical protein
MEEVTRVLVILRIKELRSSHMLSDVCKVVLNLRGTFTCTTHWGYEKSHGVRLLVRSDRDSRDNFKMDPKNVTWKGPRLTGIGRGSPSGCMETVMDRRGSIKHGISRPDGQL